MTSAQNRLYVSVGDRCITATLVENDATGRFKELLAKRPVTVNMRDYGGFEKVGALPWSLPTFDRDITTTPGDIMFYLGNNIVFFYGSNSWEYTPLGRFDDPSADHIREFFSGSDVSVILSLAPLSAIDEVVTDEVNHLTVCDLSGRRIDMSGKGVEDLQKGFYIINGKKRIIG